MRLPISWDAPSLVMLGMKLETSPIEASMSVSPRTGGSPPI